MNFIINALNLFNPFRKPTPAEMLNTLIEDYTTKLIEAENQAAYNKKLAEYYKDDLTRLRNQQQVLVPSGNVALA